MEATVGLEPTTYCLGGSCSIHLSYVAAGLTSHSIIYPAPPRAPVRAYPETLWLAAKSGAIYDLSTNRSLVEIRRR